MKGKKSRHRDQQTFIGTVQKKCGGFAFILPKPGYKIPDAYVARAQAQKLMNGDEVLFSVERKGPRTSARIEKILKRAVTQIVVQVVDSKMARTMDDDFFQWTHSSPIKRGHWILARIDRYPDDGRVGQLQVQQDLGEKLLPKHDAILTAARFSLPTRFPKDVEEATSHLAKLIKEEFSNPERNDLRNLPFVTIDGPDAKDFDDAILVVASKGRIAYKLYVSIADVAFYVRPGKPIDEEARRRATSVYFPGSVIPMLPEELSNNLCSLRPREDKLSVTAEISYDHEANLLDATFYNSSIRTVERLTYEEAQKRIEKKESAMLGEAYALFKQLQKKRKERGVLEFLLLEGIVEVDKEGAPTRLFPAPHFETHELIEEFMIAANSFVARVLREEESPTLYRVHEPPDAMKIENVFDLAKRLGAPVPKSRLSESDGRKSLSKLLEATRNLPIRETVHRTLLRAQRQARYEPDPRGHFGLALKDYCHFTSPIRRYPDLIVHRALKQLMGSSKNADTSYGEDPTHMAGLGEATSNLERRAMEAERFIVKRKQCWFMKEKLGQSFECLVTDVQKNGLFVEVAGVLVEGYAPMESLHGAFHFDEDRLRLVARGSQMKIAIGDKMTLTLAMVDVDLGRITFSQ